VEGKDMLRLVEDIEVKDMYMRGRLWGGIEEFKIGGM
jgi:hypothetical protein